MPHQRLHFLGRELLLNEKAGRCVPQGVQTVLRYHDWFAVQRNAAPLEALVTLYGRASLVQKDLGASTADLLKFTDGIAVALRASGSSAEESSGALLQLSQLLGSGTVRAEEFNSVQEGALPILQAVAAGIKEAGGSVATLRKLVIDGKLSSKAFFDGFEAGSSVLTDKVANAEQTVSSGFIRLQNVLTDTAGKLNDASGASKTVGRALEDMAAIIAGIGGIVKDFADSGLGHLTSRLYEVLNPIGELIDKIGGLKNLPAYANAYAGALQEVIFKSKPPTAQKTPDQILREQLAAASKGSRVGSTPKPSFTNDQISDRINSAFATGVTPVSLADYPVDPSGKPKKVKKAGTKGVPKTADSRFNDDLQDVKDRTAALREEMGLVGKSNEVQEQRRMAIDLEQKALADLREEARRKGETDLESIKLSDEQKAKIDAVSAAYAKQADELRKVHDTQERAEQAAGEFYETFKSGAIDALTGAKSLGDALSGLAEKLGDLLLNSAFDSLFKPASGGDSGGTFGSLFSGIGNLIGFDKGGYTGSGGKFEPAGVVHKGEYVIPKDMVDKVGVGGIESMMRGFASGGLVGAMRAPSMPSLRSASSQSPVVVHFSPVIDARGADAAAVARIEQSMARQKAELPSTIIATVRKANNSNVKLR